MPSTGMPPMPEELDETDPVDAEEEEEDVLAAPPPLPVPVPPPPPQATSEAEVRSVVSEKKVIDRMALHSRGGAMGHRRSTTMDRRRSARGAQARSTTLIPRDLPRIP